MNIKVISSFFIFILFTSSIATAASVTPETNEVSDVMNNYDLGGQNNSLQLACEIGQYVSENYNWNCDIRQLNFTKHAPVYLNVFYPAAPNKKGYEAYYGWFGPQKKEVTSFTGNDKRMYYTDWYEPAQGKCAISGVCSFGIVQSYFGNAPAENETGIPVESVEVNESTQPVVVVVPEESHDNEKIVMVGSDNSSVETNKLENTTISTNVTDSNGTINNQGIIDTVKQYWFDFKNANLNNVTFNFWGN